MKRLKNLFRINPIIVKEIRSRMRGPRAFITLTAILLATGGVMFALLQIILATSRYNTVLSAQVGQNLFAALAFLELFTISAVTPAITAGAISSEKERQTYEMLMATPLSPASILWGKLISALSYVFLLLFAAVPLASLVFIFGGVAPREMLKALLVLLAVAAAFGVVGLFMSTLFGRTGRATIASFIVVLLMLLGPLFITVLVAALQQGEPPRWILTPSPISALSAALAPATGINTGNQFFYILSGVFNIGTGSISQTHIPRPLYHYSLPLYALLSLVLYMLATRLVQPTRRWMIKRKELVVGLASLLGLAVLVAAGFLLTADRYERAVPHQPGFQEAMALAPAVVRAERAVAVKPAQAGAAPTATAALAPGGDLSLDDQAEIYAAIARQFYVQDHTFGSQPPDWPILYLISVTDDGVGAPEGARGEPVALDKEIMGGVAGRLEDLPAKVIWIENRDLAALDSQTGAVENGKGAIITFGNIHQQEDGSVHVPASLYFGSLGAAGKTYVLSFIDGAWQITGITGAEWIS